MMASREHDWYGPGPPYQPSGQTHTQHRDQDDPYRPHHPGHRFYPLPDPRERERQRFAPDPRYRHYMNTPPPRSEFAPAYSSTPQSGQSYGPNRTRPHSRQAPDYPPQSFWDYRDYYGHYDYDYYRGHYGYPDASAWSVQDGWRSEGYQGRGVAQEWAGATFTEERGYAARRDSSQYDYGMSGSEERESMETGYGDGEAGENGVLARSKASGLSSSSYELSQYINGTEHNDTVPMYQRESKEIVPQKFYVPHVTVSFGPSGQLVRVCPAHASQGEPAQVELHSLEVILSDTKEQHDMRAFPGPLAREDLHKVDAINFALKMADVCVKDEKLGDASTAALLWHLLVLLCRQNGRIVGSDIAELLMGDRRRAGVCEDGGECADVGSLIDLNETPSSETQSLNTADLLTGETPTDEETSQQNLQNYTKLLLAGRKKEALESAMRSGLWGHALFLASKMDGRTYTSVLSRFTGSLSPSDPLQTLFQLLSGRVPAVAVSYSREKWVDWRPHLAVMLSNDAGDCDMQRKSIITMGDTLVSRGLLHAAHICYLTAQSGFGCYTDKTQRLVLLGSSQRSSFDTFCQNSAIRCTEMFEYCQRLGDPSFIMSSFQVYKFLYACRLLDCGLASQAFHYCEVVAKALLLIRDPHLTLMREVIKFADQLKHSEGQLSETGADHKTLDPDWLILLHRRFRDIQMGNYDCSSTQPSEVKDWMQEESRKHADGPSVSEEVATPPDVWHHVPVEENYIQPQFGTQQTHSSFPSDEQPNLQPASYPSEEAPYTTTQPEQQSHPHFTLHEQSYPPVGPPHPAQARFPPTYAPVPMYSQHGDLAVALAQPPAMSRFPPKTAGQNGSNPADVPYVRANDSVGLRSRSNTDAEFSRDGNMTESTEKGRSFDDLDLTTPDENDIKGSSCQKSEKATKSGWFSGWFWSKSKESPQNQNSPKSTEVKPAQKETPPGPTFPVTGSPPPMSSPTIPPALPQASGINPFSRRAVQKPSTAVGENFGSLSQGP